VSDADWVGLAEAVERLRAEFELARELGEGKQLRFEIGDVEMEFHVSIRRDGGGNGAVRLGVVTLGAKGSVGDEHTHRLKVLLHPQDDQGRPAQISRD
jgi:hypothetical protein